MCKLCEIKVLAVSLQLFTVWAHIRKQFVFAHFLTEELARLRGQPHSPITKGLPQIPTGWERGLELGKAPVFSHPIHPSSCLSYVLWEFLLKSQSSLFRYLNIELFVSR